MSRLLESPRLFYRPLADADQDVFHALIIDDHVRRYLLDGLRMDRTWCQEQIRGSDSLFAEFGAGIWMARLAAEDAAAAIGFCGFIRFDETGPQPQLLYALTAAYAGRGLATEMARALVEFVRRNALATEIISAVDEPNVASARVLEKVGFQPNGSSPGAFGRMLHFRLAWR